MAPPGAQAAAAQGGLDPQVLAGILGKLDEAAVIEVFTAVLQLRPELAVKVVNFAVPDLTYPPASILTTGRVSGVIRGYDSVSGSSNIDCPPLKNVFGHDVVVSGRDLGQLQQGQPVTFSVALSKDNKPQAYALAEHGGSAGSGGGCTAVAEWGSWDQGNGGEAWNHKSKQCVHYQNGSCKNGANCNFWHDESERREPDFSRRPPKGGKEGKGKDDFMDYKGKGKMCGGKDGGKEGGGKPDFMQMMTGMMAMMMGCGGDDGGKGDMGWGKGKGKCEGGMKGKGDMDNSQSPLVEEVKRLQRQNVEFKTAWWAYCSAEGRGVRDPSRHGDPFLSKFLTDWHSGIYSDGVPVVSSGPADPTVIEMLKQMQRSDPQAKDMWGMYCSQRGKGIKDPAGHDASFVEAFIEQYSNGTLQEELIAAAPPPAPAPGGFAGAGGDGWMEPPAKKMRSGGW